MGISRPGLRSVGCFRILLGDGRISYVGGAIADSAPTPEPRVRAFPSRGSSEYGPLSLTPYAVNGVVAVSMQ